MYVNGTITCTKLKIRTNIIISIIEVSRAACKGVQSFHIDQKILLSNLRKFIMLIFLLTQDQ